MTSEPISLRTALDTITEYWNPRIATTVNDWDVRLAKVIGDYVWHTHHDTDELFVVLDGQLEIGLREPAGERIVRLGPLDIYTVRRGTEHRPSSVGGASILLFEPTGLLTTGDYAGAIPDHITSTTGSALFG